MRRTAKRLRSDNPVVQLAAIHRCAADFKFLTEGPCLRPLLEAIRDLGGTAAHVRPGSPGSSKPTTAPASHALPPPASPASMSVLRVGMKSLSGPAAVSGGSGNVEEGEGDGEGNKVSRRNRMPRDAYGYAPNLVVALRAVGAFMRDEPMPIPEVIPSLPAHSSVLSRCRDFPHNSRIPTTVSFQKTYVFHPCIFLFLKKKNEKKWKCKYVDRECLSAPESQRSMASSSLTPSTSWTASR